VKYEVDVKICKLNHIIKIWLKYIFGLYYCCFYLIWFLFSFCVQLGHHFRQIMVNLVLFTNGD